jgi:hypothetical protein
MDDDHVEKVHVVVHENRCLTVREVSQEVGICKSLCHMILTEKLKMHPVATIFGLCLLTESMNFWRSMRRLLYPAALCSRFGPCGLFLVPRVEIHPKRSSISDSRGDNRKFAIGPSRHPTKHVPGCVPELEKMLGAVYQQ